MTDYKALCTELLEKWDSAPTPSDIIDTDAYGVIGKIRIALETEESMTEQHPITPPPELMEAWSREVDYSEPTFAQVAIKAARWGSDQELEACCKWASQFNYDDYRYQDELQNLRRLKPPSLKKQALSALYAIATGADDTREFHQDIETIKAALEQLDD